jgi:hypothetical protein
MRSNSKPDIRLEAPEQLQIYLMPDVISQRFGVARLCVCERQIWTDDRGPAYIPQPRGYGRGEAEDSLRPRAPGSEKNPHPGGRAEDLPLPTRLRRNLQRRMGYDVLNWKTEGAVTAGRSRLETVQAITSMRLIVEDRAQVPNGEKL